MNTPKLTLLYSEQSKPYLEHAKTHAHADGTLGCPIEDCVFNLARWTPRRLGLHLRTFHGKYSENSMKGISHPTKQRRRKKAAHKNAPVAALHMPENINAFVCDIIAARVTDWTASGRDIWREVAIKHGVIDAKARRVVIPDKIVNLVQTEMETMLREKISPIPLIIEQKAEMNIAEAIARASSDALVMQLASRLGMWLNVQETAAKDAAPALWTAAPKIPVMQEVPQVTEKPRQRIMIIGAFRQEHKVREKLGNAPVDLIFKDHINPRETLPTVHHVICAKKWISHSDSTNARQFYGNKHVTVTGGGAVDIVNVINRVMRG